MNVVRWNPFAELDEFLGRRLGDQAAANDGLGWHPAVDIRETDKAYVFDLEIPAVSPSDITVSVRANVLSVSGERDFSSDDSEGQVHRRERRHGKFTRSFRLPNDANDEGDQRRRPGRCDHHQRGEAQAGPGPCHRGAGELS